MRHLLQRWLASIAVGALFAAGTIMLQPAFAASASVAQSATLAGSDSLPEGGESTAGDSRPVTDTTFDPGLIISDYNFFNSRAMDKAGIQDFLEEQVCVPRDDSPCLADYHQDTPNEPADGAGHCTSYIGADNEPASRILAKVAVACGISPRVLLVTVQKEQSLVSRPSASGYLHATGYGCPDTAECDRDYFGFFNQIYEAAWQFREYTQDQHYRYRIGTFQVRFHPNVACGSSPVKIQNQATANLYNYTPYQPDHAAVEGLGDGGGAACSTHGNLNFWTLYNAWFGSSTAVRYPVFFDSCLNLVGGQPCQKVHSLPSS